MTEFTNEERARWFLGLSRSCAAEVYASRAPTPAYAERAALLLAGTAASESALVHVRQKKYAYETVAGAWGYWQTERIALVDTVADLKRRHDLRARCAAWLYDGGPSEGMDAILAMGPTQLCRAAAAWPRLAVMLCRLDYYRESSSIPDGVDGQAAYWKKYYNTVLGAGTVAGYKAAYARMIAPFVA